MIKPQPLQNPITKIDHFVEMSNVIECGKNEAIFNGCIVTINNYYCINTLVSL